METEFKQPRMKRERKTVEVMIRYYCKKKHSEEEDLCEYCTELMDYAFKRLQECPFQENKTICAKCPVHCYKPSLRAKIREVMRYSGPRMIYKHPYLAIRHLIDRRRKEPKET